MDAELRQAERREEDAEHLRRRAGVIPRQLWDPEPGDWVEVDGERRRVTVRAPRWVQGGALAIPSVTWEGQRRWERGWCWLFRWREWAAKATDWGTAAITLCRHGTRVIRGYKLREVPPRG